MAGKFELKSYEGAVLEADGHPDYLAVCRIARGLPLHLVDGEDAMADETTRGHLVAKLAELKARGFVVDRGPERHGDMELFKARLQDLRDFGFTRHADALEAADLHGHLTVQIEVFRAALGAGLQVCDDLSEDLGVPK